MEEKLWHELVRLSSQCVADEHRITNPVRHACRRVARGVDHFSLPTADGEVFAILEQMIEFAAVARNVGRIEYGAEDALHLADMLADANLCTGFSFTYGVLDKWSACAWVSSMHSSLLNVVLHEQPPIRA